MHTPPSSTPGPSSQPTKIRSTHGSGHVHQRDVIAFLSDAKNYGADITHVERIDTHASIVFLAGNRAYKIKRAARYPYLDFSTATKRRIACENELRRNTHFAPNLYLNLLTIVKTRDGKLAFGQTENDEATAIEWVVEMKRFPANVVFDQLAATGKLSIERAQDLARTVSRCHANAPRHLTRRADEDIENALTASVTTLSSATDLLGLNRVRKYSTLSLAEFNATSNIMRRRARDGCVRLCHGDLHLQNIVLLDNKPTLFDSIEFNDDIATIDVFYDLSFLLMDLARHNLPDHANAVFNTYLETNHHGSDLSGLALMPLFQALRAAIRAMVLLDKIPFLNNTSTRQQTERDLKNYVSLALQFLQPPKPTLVAIGGLSGSGKTTVARHVASRIGRAPGAVHLRTDIERKKLFATASESRLDADAYTPQINDQVYDLVLKKAASALKAGHSVIVDATFLSPERRRDVEQRTHAAGAEFCGVWLDAPPDILMARVKARTNDASDADTNVLQAQLEYDTGPIHWTNVSAASDIAEIVSKVSKLTHSPGPATPSNGNPN